MHSLTSRRQSPALLPRRAPSPYRRLSRFARISGTSRSGSRPCRRGRHRAPRKPRNPGLCRKRGTDPLSKLAGLGVARPALEETRYFPPIVVGSAQRGSRSAPQVANGRCAATRGPRLAFTSARVSRAWCRGCLCPVGVARSPARDVAGVAGSARRRSPDGGATPALRGEPTLRVGRGSRRPFAGGPAESASTGRTDLSDRSGASRRRTLLRTGRASFPASGSSEP